MSLARQWFKSKYPNDKNKFYTSRFYSPDNSWPKTNVWWLQIPLSAIDTDKFNYVNLICQAAIDTDSYHYLKVPSNFLNNHLEKFHRIGQIISIYLSAEEEKLFIEERGIGSLSFSDFLVSDAK